MPQETGSKYEKAIREVVSAVQILIYRRENSPIRGRDEVYVDLERRLGELGKLRSNGKSKWRKQILELAAYAIFSAVADAGDE